VAARVGLANAWRAAAPFPHLIFDDFVAADALAQLMAILVEEPVDPYEGDIFTFEASAPEPQTAELRQLRESFANTLAAPLSRITGKPLARADLRAYACAASAITCCRTDHQRPPARARVAYCRHRHRGRRARCSGAS
jgi:hypothetical protein